MKTQAGSSRKPLIHGAALCGLALLAVPAHAQVNALKTVTGMTDTQRAVAVAIDSLCPAIGGTANRTGTQAQRFAASCSMLVASKLNAGNAFDLDLTDGQLRPAMDRYGGKENVSTGSTATNAPGGNALLGRFLQLHQGATGFNLADAQIDIDGRRTTLAQLAGQKGGAAGDESVTGTGWGGFANLTYGTGDKDTPPRAKPDSISPAGTSHSARITGSMTTWWAVPRCRSPRSTPTSIWRWETPKIKY